MAGSGVTASAQKANDGTVYIRVASASAGSVQLVVGGKPVDGTFNVTVLNGGVDATAANSPGNPTQISPITSMVKISSGTLIVGPNSFTVVKMPT